MKSEQRSQAFLRKRKMLMVLPLLIIPFLTMAFWALGGGSAKKAENNKSQGLNLNLPSSDMEESRTDNKLSFYERADKDSMKLEELMRNDPYYRDRMNREEDKSLKELEGLTANTASKFKQPLNTSPYDKQPDNPEQKLIEKLSLLQREVNNTDKMSTKTKSKSFQFEKSRDMSLQMDKLQDLMEVMGGSSGQNQEIKQLDSTLEKILDIQHPERVREKVKEKSLKNKEAVFGLKTERNGVVVSIIDTSKSKTRASTGFYGLSNDFTNDVNDNTVEAIIHSDQTLVNGAVVRLRLANDAYINGRLVPNGSFLNGVATLNDERLDIEVKSIRCGNSILPVQLDVYDLDGLPGIYVPGAITRDIVKQSADNSIQVVGLNSLNQSLKAQAATAGINTAKNLLSRKVKQVKVTVKAGYRVLLKNKGE